MEHTPVEVRRQRVSRSDGDDSWWKNNGRFGNVVGISCGRVESFVGGAHAPRPTAMNPQVAGGLEALFSGVNFTGADSGTPGCFAKRDGGKVPRVHRERQRALRESIILGAVFTPDLLVACPSIATRALVNFSNQRQMTHGKVNERTHAGRQDALSGIDNVNRQILRLPLRQNLHQLSGGEFVLDQPIW